MASQKSSVNEANKFKETLNLPRTDFSIRANSGENDPLTLDRWKNDDLYNKATACNEGSKKWILHDGPPYANGNIHLGHAYNKILKDTISKAHRMMGFHVPITPGWDCHGLPIELKVSKENPDLSGIELKKECRDYAMKWVNTQRDEFKKLGVVMDWDNPYITMDPSYEANILRAFAGFVEKGFVARKNKTIPWCATCQTTLASAEIEYQDRKDPSIYVLFELDKQTQQAVFPDIDGPINLVIWTTTPWTIPLNRAVILKPKAEYQLLKLKDTYVIVGTPLADKLAELVESEKEVVATFASEKLEGSKAQHPLVDLQVPVLFDGSVGLDEGTACVHSAPGCGPIDYEIGVKNNLEIYSPLTADGKYSDEIAPAELEGMLTTDGQIWVIRALAASGKLFAKKSIRHSFPHCWRCRNGLMFRATPQWFCNLDHEGVKQKALDAIADMTFYPERGRNFLSATVGNRWEWCLSRQRSWGVPIPALISKDESDLFVSADFIKHVAQQVEKEGVEYWDRITVQELVAEGALPADFPVDSYRKEMDILDVWFDSGVSHFAVLKNNEKLQFPADLYLEGVDQHRGWFQSSLLSSMILHGEPQTRAVMTHGFTVDEKGHKMSKSLGNVVSPQDIIGKLGTDGLRLWVASVGHDGDAVVNDALIKNLAHVFRKVRNTCRFLLQNLYDYKHETDASDINDLQPIDKYALRKLVKLQESIVEEYKNGNLTAVSHALNDYCTVELSSFYGDIVKDRLYCEKSDGAKRRSTQTAFWYMLDTMTRLMAPIMSFTAEQVSDHYQSNKTESIHLQQFADLSFMKEVVSDSEAIAHDEQWQKLKEMRSAVLKLIEVQREAGSIKHSLEAGVTLFSDALQGFDLGDNPAQFLKEFFIVSHVELISAPEGLEESAYPGLFVKVEHAAGVKCPRCWHWDANANTEGLCARCQGVV